MEAPRKSYAEAFCSKFSQAQNLAHKRHKGFQEIITLLELRMGCELQYGKSLRNIGSSKHSLSQG